MDFLLQHLDAIGVGCLIFGLVLTIAKAIAKRTANKVDDAVVEVAEEVLDAVKGEVGKAKSADKP